MLQLSPIFIATGIGGILLIVAVFLAWHYRSLYKDLQSNEAVTSSSLKQREIELVGLVDQTTKQEARMQAALLDAHSKLDDLEKMVDACMDPAVVRFRLNQLGGMLSVLSETTRKPDDISRALADTQRLPAPTPTGATKVPDKGT